MDILKMTAEQARAMASVVMSGSDAHRLAVELCMLCGVDPHAYSACAGSLSRGPSIPNWQFVIAEQLLGSALRIALRGGPAGGIGNGG